MNVDLRPENSREFLKKTIQMNSDDYGLAYIKCAIINEKGEKFLYLADVKVQHKDDLPIQESVFEYDKVTLATFPFELSELGELIDKLGSEKITIKSISNIKAPGEFSNSCYHISNRTRYAGFYKDWPCFCFRFDLKENVHLDNVYEHLTKPRLPAYPDFREACRAYFQHEHLPNQNDPVNINFLIPIYKARFKLLEIAETQLSFLVETRECPLENLVIQVYCKKGEKQFQNSNDLKLDSKGEVKFIADFIPDHVHAYLVNQKTNETMDVKEFGEYYSDRNDGIIIKTSVESVETMIAKGETQYVEFKRDIDKEQNEFLESVVAFANTNDGTIILGVDDEGRVMGHYVEFDKRIRGLVSGH